MASDSPAVPHFSIVIPVFNREREIVRALNSCLLQSFPDFEAVVVDDASQDDTPAAVAALGDSRIFLVRHAENRGVCPARNTGISRSRGEWVLFLDSDDELMPDSLALIHSYTRSCPEDIERLGFVYRREDGSLSPEPVPRDTVLDYEDYIAWTATVRPSDFFHCTRRRAFEKVRFAESRAYESSYLLDFARCFRTRMVPETVALIHTDSANRDNNIPDRSLREKFIREAADAAASTEYILDRHGSALLRRAPARYRIYRKALVSYSLMAGHRWEGSRQALSYLRNYPGCLEGWVIWLSGLIGPAALARMKIWKQKALTGKREKHVRQG